MVQRLAVAPMMGYTDRHFRYFLRLITPHAWLYTEMLSTTTLLYGDQERLLAYHPHEQPLVLQLGGSDPVALARCAVIATQHGFAAINLNVGCPSDRVREGQFGACLMKQPQLVADCVAAMCAATTLPITVKTRIGVDDCDSYAQLQHFVAQVAAAGCNTFIIHARKAWLKGLSPKENRTIPPLDYPRVYQLKRDFPQLTIILNGGIHTTTQVEAALEQVDGVMIGRQACRDPYFLAALERLCYPATLPPPSRLEVLQQLLPYIRAQLAQGQRLSALLRHTLGLFHGCPGAQAWRRCLSSQAQQPEWGMGGLEQIVQHLVNHAL